jgi:hypothetical protein
VSSGSCGHFLPGYLSTRPILTPAQWRAIRAITHCRTPALGGHRYACAPCGQEAFAFHSCNHKACPQCGREATREWVERELAKRIQAPYFMVTFTLPAELREVFFRPHAKIAYDTFFAAAAAALQDCLVKAKWLGAATSGFTAILHTWNQQLHFHPHLHVIVPAAGLDANGNVLIGKNDTFLVPVPALQAAFRRHFRARLKARDWQVDPAVWHTDWGIHIQPFGAGTAAIKYLGAYVCRTAIGDHRILHADTHSVTFLWKDRAQGNRGKTMTLPGAEFVRRYLRHVLPPDPLICSGKVCSKIPSDLGTILPIGFTKLLLEVTLLAQHDSAMHDDKERSQHDKSPPRIERQGQAAVDKRRSNIVGK